MTNRNKYKQNQEEGCHWGENNLRKKYHPHLYQSIRKLTQIVTPSVTSFQHSLSPTFFPRPDSSSWPGPPNSPATEPSPSPDSPRPRWPAPRHPPPRCRTPLVTVQGHGAIGFLATSGDFTKGELKHSKILFMLKVKSSSWICCLTFGA